MSEEVIKGTGSLLSEIGQHATEQPQAKISDRGFIDSLNKLKDLRSFLIQEAVSLPRGFSFGNLNLLSYSDRGRAASEVEWEAIESKTEALLDALTEPLRRKFVRGTIPRWLAVLAIALAFLSAVSLVWAVIVQDIGLFGLSGIGVSTLPLYIVWLMSLGGIGSIAFVGMNALSVQQDITFDLSNTRLMLLRISLGGLFALILTLPFGFISFIEFVRLIYQGGPLQPGKAIEALEVTRQAVLLLLPFILGYSTSLVIMILNRFVDAIHAFFGKSGANEVITSRSRVSTRTEP